MKGASNIDPRMNNFYVEMDASLMHIMKFPKKFAKMFKGSIRENVELVGPSSVTWHVKMISFNNKFALRFGWKDFVTANQIDENDILVFTYNNNSSFKVAIFDPSGCQKAAPFFAKKTVTETDKESEKSDDSLIRELAALDHEVKNEIISLTSGSSDTDESSNDISSRAARVRRIEERVCGKRKLRDSVQELTENESDSESDDGYHKTVRKRKTRENRTKKDSRFYVIPHRTHLTPAQKEIANRMTRKTQKGSELFVKILNPVNTHTHRNCVLNLPVGFACKLVESKRKKKITLLPADLDKRNSITANYHLMNKKTVCIKKGWRQFVRTNGLKQGNLCLFELRKQDKQGILTMVVHFNN